MCFAFPPLHDPLPERTSGGRAGVGVQQLPLLLGGRRSGVVLTGSRSFLYFCGRATRTPSGGDCGGEEVSDPPCGVPFVLDGRLSERCVGRNVRRSTHGSTPEVLSLEDEDDGRGGGYSSTGGAWLDRTVVEEEEEKRRARGTGGVVTEDGVAPVRAVAAVPAEVCEVTATASASAVVGGSEGGGGTVCTASSPGEPPPGSDDVVACDAIGGLFAPPVSEAWSRSPVCCGSLASSFSAFTCGRPGLPEVRVDSFVSLETVMDGDGVPLVASALSCEEVAPVVGTTSRVSCSSFAGEEASPTCGSLDVEPASASGTPRGVT